VLFIFIKATGSYFVPWAICGQISRLRKRKRRHGTGLLNAVCGVYDGRNTPHRV
jgi:hypothetical protein